MSGVATPARAWGKQIGHALASVATAVIRARVLKAPLRPGFTLLEMLIVVGILAMLALVAVKSLEPLADQSRYEATRQTLLQVDAAILGDASARQPDGTLVMTGFVADIGRPPTPLPTDTQLDELWDASGWGSFPFRNRPGPTAPSDYSDIQLPCGWRGPYLRLGVGTSDLRDGWGQPFTVTSSNGLVQTIRWTAVSPFPDDMVTDVSTAFTSVSGTVTNDSALPTSATVVLLYPNPNISTTTLAVATDADANVGSFRFDNIPLGLRAIRAVIDGHTVTKYVYVPRTGLSLTLNYTP